MYLHGEGRWEVGIEIEAVRIFLFECRYFEETIALISVNNNNNNNSNNNNNNNHLIKVLMDLAEQSGFINWGDYKSTWLTTNQIKCWVFVRGENRSTRGEPEYPGKNLSE